jgi:hypothetical protein
MILWISEQLHRKTKGFAKAKTNPIVYFDICVYYPLILLYHVYLSVSSKYYINFVKVFWLLLIYINLRLLSL